MALTGLVLAGFVLGHMTGNLLMFKSPAAINAYAKWLHENVALLWTARTVLIISVSSPAGVAKRSTQASTMRPSERMAGRPA